MRIIITGTPGTGKSTVAKELSKKLGIEIIDCKKIIEGVKAYKFNEEGEMEVLLPKFRNELKKVITEKKDWIIENHLLCEIKISANFIFVFRCEKKILEKRMKKRGYRLGKIEDNLMVELLDYCFVKARRNLVGKLFELDTSKKSIKKCTDEIVSVVKGKREKLDSVDYSKELISYVTKE